METDSVEMVIGLYQRWLGHEGHELVPDDEDEDEGFWCRTCLKQWPPVINHLQNLRTDWNAMGRLIAAVEDATGYEVTMGGARGKKHAAIWGPHPIAYQQDDTLPIAVCRAVDQIPKELPQRREDACGPERCASCPGCACHD